MTFSDYGRLGAIARQEQLTAEQRSKASQQGGKARMGRLTARERKRLARRAAEARWRKPDVVR